MKNYFIAIAMIAITSLSFLACEEENNDEAYELQSTEKDCGSSPGQKACDE